MTTLTTARLVLRRAREDDLSAFHAILSDPRAMRYWSTDPHTSIEQTRAWLGAMIASPPALSEDFVIEHEGELIGKVGFYRLPEIGFILRPDRWGLGLAKEAARAAIEHVFATRTIDALVADADPRNAASLALLASLGFVKTGAADKTFFVGGVWTDSVFLELKRESYTRSTIAADALP